MMLQDQKRFDLPLVREILTTRDHVDTALRAARSRAAATDTDADKYVFVQLRGILTALNQMAAAILGGARYRNVAAIGWSAAAVVAAIVVGVLSLWIPASLAAVVAFPAAVAASYLTPRWWVRSRFRVGARAIDATDPRGSTTTATLPEVVASVRRGVTAINLRMRDHPAATAPIVFDAINGRNARAACRDAWLATARVVHAIDAPTAAGYQYMIIDDAASAPDDLVNTVKAAATGLGPVTDDIADRGASAELAAAYAHLAAAADILGHTRVGLGEVATVLPKGHRFWLTYVLATLAEVGSYAVVVWLLLQASVVPAFATAAVGAVAMSLVSWVLVRWRRQRAVAISSDPQFTVDLAQLTSQHRGYVDDIKRVWTATVNRHAARLRGIADTVIADIDHLEDDVFDAAFDALPAWRQRTYLNLNLAAVQLDHVSGRVAAWSL